MTDEEGGKRLRQPANLKVHLSPAGSRHAGGANGGPH